MNGALSNLARVDHVQRRCRIACHIPRMERDWYLAPIRGAVRLRAPSQSACSTLGTESRQQG